MKDQIKEAIRYWWNDSMRKTWQTDLADPDLRHRCLDELGDEIVRHLISQSSGPDEAEYCPHCENPEPCHCLFCMTQVVKKSSG